MLLLNMFLMIMNIFDKILRASILKRLESAEKTKNKNGFGKTENIEMVYFHKILLLV